MIREKVDRIIKILFIMMLTVSFSDAQYPRQQSVIYPSPNPASLGVYGEVPVSYFTGVPEISIPIYEIKTNTLSLPITLTYHASGIKVSQEASWVGLGWALNAGGVITRVVRGLDDFNPPLNLGFYYNSNLPPNYPDNSGEDLADNVDTYRALYQGKQDPEPDLFYYNFGGYSGEMVYSPQKKQFMPLKANNLQIQYENGKWEIYTAEGIKYVFKTTELSTNYVYSGNFEFNDQGGTYNVYNLGISGMDHSDPQTVNTWYLDSIIAPDKDYIVFKYDSVNRQIASQIYKSESSFIMKDFQLISMENGYVTPQISGRYDTHYASQSVTNIRDLKQIMTSEGLKMDFITSDRTDLQPTNNFYAQRLDQVSISTSSNSTVLETYNFFYTYFNDFPPYYKNRRLRLDSLTHCASGICNPPYIFSYYNSGYTLPPKDSKSIDHWGYFNNADNTQPSDWGNGGNTGSLIPTYTVPGTFTTYQGANRDVNELAAMTNTLDQIKYPTGGYTNFTYELNDYNVSGNTSIPQNHYFQATASSIPGDTISRITDQVSFTITKAVQATLSYNAYSSDQAKTCVGSNVIINYTGMDGYNYGVLYANNNPSSPLKILKYNVWNIQCPYPTKPQTESIVLQPGTYTIQSLITINHFRTMVSISYTDSVATQPYTKIVKMGGLRIKRIESNDGAHSYKKFYDYTIMREGNKISTGVQMAPLRYFYDQSFIGTTIYGNPQSPFPTTSTYSGTYTAGQSSPVTPIGSSAEGGPIGYSRVTETVDTNNTQGKSIYDFICQPEVVYQYSPFFPGIPNRINNSNGLLLRQADYSTTGLLRAVSNTYAHDGSKDLVIKGLKMITFPFLVSTTGNNDLPSLIKFYDNNVEWWKKVADTTTLYANGQYIKSTNSYYYDTTNLLPDSIISNKSNGELVLNRIYYAHNYPSETLTSFGIMDNMKSINMIGIPIKKETYVNSKRTMGSIYNYGTQLLPVSVQLLEGNNFNLRHTYDTYDSYGHLLQEHNVNDANTVYLWGYNGQYPVAKIIGSYYTTINGIVPQSQIDAATNIPNNDVNVRILLNQIREYFKTNPVIQVTTYTYSPLIGMTSETDPRGNTTFYEYDGFGRLKDAKDKDGNVAKRYDYHYQGQ